jgi:phosphinothricin acetyltransferase
MVAELRVRPAGPEDAEAIRGIYNEAVANTTATMDTEPRTADQQAYWMTAHAPGGRWVALVAQDSAGQVLGYASLSSFDPKPGYAATAEVSVYVHCDARGRGVGTHLVAALIDAARQNGFVALVASISANNDASLRLHARHGFFTVGTLQRVARKFDIWVDVVLMQHLLEERAAL